MLRSHTNNFFLQPFFSTPVGDSPGFTLSDPVVCNDTASENKVKANMTTGTICTENHVIYRGDMLWSTSMIHHFTSTEINTALGHPPHQRTNMINTQRTRRKIHALALLGACTLPIRAHMELAETSADRWGALSKCVNSTDTEKGTRR